MAIKYPEKPANSRLYIIREIGNQYTVFAKSTDGRRIDLHTFYTLDKAQYSYPSATLLTTRRKAED